jgi:hypothetical protein
MKIHQLSVFLENKPGQLRLPCEALAKAGINMVTLSLADTEQFGILRLIVTDWQKAKAVLEQAGCVVKMTEVLAIEVPDRPGGLAQILGIVDDAGLNIEYMYAFTEKRGDRGLLVFRFADPDAALGMLQKAGVNVIGDVKLYAGA